MPLTQEKICKKILGAGLPWPRGRSLKSARITSFECSHTSAGHSSRYRTMKFCRHIALGEEKLHKKLGVGPPVGNFSKFIFQDIELKICMCNAIDPGKNAVKQF